MAVWRRCVLSAALAVLVWATLRKTLVTCQSQAQSTEEDPTQATPSSLAIFSIIVVIIIVATAVCRYRGGTLRDTHATSPISHTPPSSRPSSSTTSPNPPSSRPSSSTTSQTPPPLPRHSLPTSNNTNGGSPDLLSVHRELVPIAKKWYILGIQLGVSYSTLMQIKANYPYGHERLLREVVQEWMKSDLNPSWQFLIKVLRSPSINERGLANELECRFC